MKGHSDKTKVVVRHLPPTISPATLMEQVNVAFAGRYNWFSFRSGKSSQKHQSYARAYIEFRRPEDVIEFAEFFNGHLFVNEKGTQFKAVVEYAPSQRVPKQSSKKDVREGTIYKDPEYLEFLEVIGKPAENLPSAEIQLERREAERAGAAKDATVVTPLMEFVRQKRAAKSGSRRILSNGKISRRSGGSGSPGSSSSKRGSEKKRASTRMYVLRESAKNTGGKEKSAYIRLARRDDQQLVDRTVTLTSVPGSEALEEETGSPGISDSGRKKILLLKGKEKEIFPHQSSTSAKNSSSSAAVKQSQRRDAGGRMMRSILLNKDLRRISGVQSEQQSQALNSEKDKRPPRAPNAQLILKDANGAPDYKFIGNDIHGSSGEQEKRTKNKDRPDCVVWTPFRQSDGSFASDESLSSSTSQSTQSGLDSAQGNSGDNYYYSRREVKSLGSAGNTHSSLDNGCHKYFGRRGPSHSARDADAPLVEVKSSKRGGTSGYGSHEKQVWVQKSSSGS
ncbi:hypothetical protein K2173_022202 [Erythroxylum novogranatense]|uniref:UPF3 domain-containing protein n=1 Tax=Erythroxylum novogranatense TaxID=1862640 RepID=A0AAV8STH8_9ROSI|nr:hypothetical protein K2173_022202 [Erythroxylum novogranatense]